MSYVGSDFKKMPVMCLVPQMTANADRRSPLFIVLLRNYYEMGHYQWVSFFVWMPSFFLAPFYFFVFLFLFLFFSFFFFADNKNITCIYI